MGKQPNGTIHINSNNLGLGLSSLLNHYSRVFIGFQNKTQSFHCITLSNLSIYVVLVDPHQGNKDVMSFSLSTTKAYIEFLGREKARVYL